MVADWMKLEMAQIVREYKRKQELAKLKLEKEILRFEAAQKRIAQARLGD